MTRDPRLAVLMSDYVTYDTVPSASAFLPWALDPFLVKEGPGLLISRPSLTSYASSLSMRAGKFILAHRQIWGTDCVV